MSQVVENPTKAPAVRGYSLDSDCRLAAVGASSPRRMEAKRSPVGRRRRLTLAERYALRHAFAYGVETEEGQIGHVTEVRLGPFEYWPAELVVTTLEGARLHVPVADVWRVIPREARMLLAVSPPGTQPVPRPFERPRAPLVSIVG